MEIDKKEMLINYKAIIFAYNFGSISLLFYLIYNFLVKKDFNLFITIIFFGQSIIFYFAKMYYQNQIN